MSMQYVSDENFILYAANHYDNPSCATELEFFEDLNRIKFILKMFKRYEKDEIINERLVLNHITLIYNVFMSEAATKMLVFKLSNYLHLLKPFLLLMGYWPDKIDGVGGLGFTIIGDDIPMDQEIVKRLRKL